MDPVPDPLLLRKSGSAGDRTRNPETLTTRPQRRSPGTILQAVFVRGHKSLAPVARASKFCKASPNLALALRLTCTDRRQSEVNVRSIGHFRICGRQYGTGAVSPFWGLEFGVVLCIPLSLSL